MSTQTRYTAYQHAIHTLNEMKGVKLSAQEFSVLEDAAEGRLLESEQGVRTELLDQAQDLLDRLVEADRWLKSSADDLLKQIVVCGDDSAESVE